MIVEYCAAPSADGRFRKYSAYKVGPTVYPQHCFINENWYIKFPSTRFTEADRAESRAYVADIRMRPRSSGCSRWPGSIMAESTTAWSTAASRPSRSTTIRPSWAASRLGCRRQLQPIRRFSRKGAQGIAGRHHRPRC